MMWDDQLSEMEDICGSCDGRGFLAEWYEISSLGSATHHYIPSQPECPDCHGTGQNPAPHEETFSPWPILGWRNFKLRDGDRRGYGEYKLYGQYARWDHSWYEAECNAPWNPRHTIPHSSPHWDCTCGIYLRKAPAFHWDFLALCAAEEVVEHDSGYRAARCWVLAVAPTFGRLERKGATVIRRDWPDVALRDSRYDLRDIQNGLIKYPEEIPTWEERRSNGHRQASTDHPPYEGTGPTAPQEGAF